MDIKKIADKYGINESILFDIFDDMQRYHFSCDVISYVEEDEQFTNEQLANVKKDVEHIVSRFEYFLSRNDAYWEMFWTSLNDALVEYFRGVTK